MSSVRQVTAAAPLAVLSQFRCTVATTTVALGILLLAATRLTPERRTSLRPAFHVQGARLLVFATILVITPVPSPHACEMGRKSRLALLEGSGFLPVITSLLGPRFENEIERRLGCPAEAVESGLERDLTQARLARLRAKGQPDLLRKGSRRAHHG